MWRVQARIRYSGASLPSQMISVEFFCRMFSGVGAAILSRECDIYEGALDRLKELSKFASVLQNIWLPTR